jgi:hypothetical protein
MLKRVFILTAAICAMGILPTVASAQDVHSIWSTHTWEIWDGSTGIRYPSSYGSVSMSWEDATRYGFFHAIVRPASAPIEYELVLTAVSTSDDDAIEGLWDIRRNGVLVCDGCVGRAYGLTSGIGSYFKLFVGDGQCNTQQWYLSAYVTNRFDY